MDSVLSVLTLSAETSPSSMVDSTWRSESAMSIKRHPELDSSDTGVVQNVPFPGNTGNR